MGNQIIATATKNTVLKQSFLQSSDAEVGPIIQVTKDTKLALVSHACFEDDEATPIDESNYFRVKIDTDQSTTGANAIVVQLEKLELYDWNVFKKDWLVEGDTEVTKEDDKPPALPAKKSAWDFNFKLPGYKSNFNMKKEIYPGSQLLWAEMLHFNSSTKDYRDPAVRGRGGKADVDRIVSIGKLFAGVILPYIEKKYGKVRIQVNSGYRPEPFNSRAGGASRSQHLKGNSGDYVFYRKDNGAQIDCHEMFRYLKPLAIKHRFSIASSSLFVHLDARGYYCTWSYGF